MHILKNRFSIISIMLIMLSVSFFQSTLAQKKMPSKKSDKAAPQFTLQNLDGKDVKLSDYKGKVIILDFWATWCPPCRAEIPDFIDLYKTYQKKGLIVLGVALDDKEKVKKFAKENNINYPLVIGNKDVSNLYGGISGIPTTFIIDRKGDIRKVHVGQKSKEVFENDIKELL